jgi:phosphoesterase RecJ-like protein
MAALARAARAAGKSVQMLLPDPIPRRYAFLVDGETPHGGDEFDALADAAGLVVILDTCAWQQLHGLEARLEARRSRIVVIDHHRTTDDVGGARWVDPTAAATCVLVAELLASLGWGLDAHIAEALATGIVFDTGWLRFANTSERCLRTLAELLAAGVRPDRLYAKLYQSDRPERLRLHERALRSLNLHAGGRIAEMSLTQDDFTLTGAQREENENLVNEGLRIASVEVSLLLTETVDGHVRANLRSREHVDVAAIAQRYGGGGHTRAAGVTFDGPLETARATLLAAAGAALEAH